MPCFWWSRSSVLSRSCSQFFPPLRPRKRPAPTHQAPSRCSRPARILVPGSRVSLAIRAALLRRNQRRLAPMRAANLPRMSRRFPGSLEARAVRRINRHPAENNQARLARQRKHDVRRHHRQRECAVQLGMSAFDQKADIRRYAIHKNALHSSILVLLAFGRDIHAQTKHAQNE